MLIMNSENDEKIELEIPQELSGFFHKHFDKVIVDSSLTNVEVLILSIYLIEYKKQESGVSYEKCKRLFDYFGRKTDSFGKAIYDAKAKSYIQERDKILYFLSDGLAKLNEITGRIGPLVQRSEARCCDPCHPCTSQQEKSIRVRGCQASR